MNSETKPNIQMLLGKARHAAGGGLGTGAIELEPFIYNPAA